MPTVSSQDVLALAPVAILALGGIALLLSEVFLTSGKRGYQAFLTVLFAATAGLTAFGATPGKVFAGQATADAFSAFVTITVSFGLALAALVSASWLDARGAERGEFYALSLFAASGMSLLGMASDLLVAFVAIEIMSLSTYALAAWMRRGKKPAEAAFKYFILGAFSSALLLYGTSLVFGATGSTLLSDVARGPLQAGGSALLSAGLVLVAAGLAFKVAAVPFHVWTPDVYEGAPTPVTAFMAAGVKTAAFAILARTVLAAYAATGGAADSAFPRVLAVLALLTMLVGNLFAVPQRSVKRMLAYSSIAHAGYLLLGVLAAGLPAVRERALSGVLFYLASYTASAIGAFAVVGALESNGQPGDEPADAWDLERLAGLSRRRPLLAFAMTVFMLSLAGVPPTAGFVAKLLVFQAAVGAQYLALAVVGVLTSALGAYYYLRVVVYMYMRPAAEGEPAGVTSPVLSVALAVAVAAVVVLGIGSEPVASLARAAAAVVR
ncbi:MAG: NADH-quinone oxidoreductase subunit N [Deltaproteobacteria bacterium]|nr:NADH-quinone oxidoreductase subunit N [Deltaproteobacteria bacterium]